MKRFLAILTDAVLIVFAMLASVCALPSAFGIRFEVGTLIWICMIGALLLSSWMHLPRAGVAFGAVFLLGTVAYGVYDREAIVDGAHYLWYRVMTPLSRDFSFLPVPEPIGEIPNYVPAVTSALVIIAAVFGLLIAFALIRGKLPLLTVLMPLPPFLLSLIYTNQQPAFWTTVLLLLYCAGALLGHGLRKNNAKRRGLFTVIVLPMILTLALLLPTIVPKERYTPISFEQRQQMLGRTIGELRDTVLSWFNRNPKNIDLGGEGDRSEDKETAFTIMVGEAGKYMLRMHSYGQYSDSMWLSAEEYDGTFRSMAVLSEDQKGERILVSIRDAYNSERIVPYGFFNDAEVEVGESYVHAQGRTAYVWIALRSVNPYSTHSIDAEEREYLAFAKKQYTMPAGDEKEALKAILRENGIGKGSDTYQTALNVAAFVRGSGSYSLTPGQMPVGEDFVLYFLTESHSGYCVHFASATTALLQALDIPARYTIGYNVTVPLADEWTDVPKSAAHAWAEVYIAGVGWVPIESTAGFGYALAVEQGSSGGSQGGVGPRATAEPTPVPTPVKPDSSPPELPNTGSEDATPEIPKADRSPLLGTPTPAPDGTETEKPTDGGMVVTERKPVQISAWWLTVLLVPAAIIVWGLFGKAVRKRRIHTFKQKNAKKAILKMVRYHKQLERFGVEPDPDLDDWAEEATFSNHAMKEEREELYHRICLIQNRLYMDEPLKRFYVRHIRLLL